MAMETGIGVGVSSEVPYLINTLFFETTFFFCIHASFFPDNTLYFWKYPEDEQKRKAPIENETISLHDCTSETITLAPRDVCSRMNTFLLENRRRIQSGDCEALNIVVVRLFCRRLYV